MILLEVVDAERRRVTASKATGDTHEGPTLRHPELAHTPPPASPKLPDYALSQAQAELEKQELKAKAEKQRQKKLWRIITYVLAAYLVLSVGIGVPLFILFRNKQQLESIKAEQAYVKANSRPPPADLLPPYVTELPSSLGKAVECNGWSYVAATETQDAYYSLQYSFPSNETIYIRSNFTEIEDDQDINSQLTGSLRVTVGSTNQNATISVAMKDIGDDALREANVCLMSPNATEPGSGWGLAIYVPNDTTTEEKYSFDLELVLPSNEDSSKLYGLNTYLPSFNQTFENLETYTNLSQVSIQGSLGSINFEYVQATSIFVQTSAAEIVGTFNVSDNIRLETVLAPIVANISAYNDGESQPTQIDVENGNSDINLNVSLYTFSNVSAKTACTPQYMSMVKTFSGFLEAAYYHDISVPRSQLYVLALNSVEPAWVFVDDVFEGTYDVHTSLGEAVVDRTTTDVDPLGMGRTRTFIDDRTSSSRRYGWVGWGERPVGPVNNQGHIEVASSLNSAVLQLTEVPDTDDFTSSKVSSKAIFSQV